jgi:hypothetical protein
MMEKLEATILILVVLVGLGGMYYFFTASSGGATRMLVGCEGDFTLQLRLGGARESADYRFKGIGGTVQILDIEESKAKFLLDGVETPYLGFQDVYLGQQAGIKMSKTGKTTVSFCMASTVPECVAYVWDLDAKTKICKEVRSSADYKFEQGGRSAAFS